MQAIYLGTIDQHSLTELPRLVLSSSRAGDAAAQDIVDRLADEIVAMVVSALRRLAMTRRDSDVVLGKFAGALGLVLVLVLATLVYPIGMFRFPWVLGPLDPGPVFSGYLGLILFSAAATSLGLLISSFADSQAVAFFITFFVLAALWFFDNAAQFLTSSGTMMWLAPVLQYVSFQSRLSGFWRGLVDLRDIVFFISVTCLSLAVAFRALERRKWA
jgi:ABC-2 type transport system permease protein